MPSPFPGMNPYLEAPDWWHAVHNKLANKIQEQITPHLRPRYYADIEIRNYTDDEAVRIMIPDVSVLKTRGRDLPAPTPVAVALVPAPLTYAVLMEPPEKSYTVNIYDARNEQLVTAIEILSPANKQIGHDAYFQYRRKRQRLLLSEAHLMEIDLLRGGERLPFDRSLPPAPYFVSLSRANKRPTAELWPLYWQDAIPLLPVPLLSPDADVPLNLNTIIAEVYELGAYDVRIDYTAPPPLPRLSPSDQQWLDAQLREQGLR